LKIMDGQAIPQPMPLGTPVCIDFSGCPDVKLTCSTGATCGTGTPTPGLTCATKQVCATISDALGNVTFRISGAGVSPSCAGVTERCARIIVGGGDFGPAFGISVGTPNLDGAGAVDGLDFLNFSNIRISGPYCNRSNFVQVPALPAAQVIDGLDFLLFSNFRTSAFASFGSYCP
jgi:hypothetical protein